MRSLVGLPAALALLAPDLSLAGQAASPHSPPSQITQVAMARPLASQPTASRPMAPLPAAPTKGHPALTPDPATMCETAVTTAEYINRLPPRLLGAISLTETGRLEPATTRLRPWPWTINAEGEGQFFDTPQAAIAAVKTLQARGVQSIDVGCLQVNLMFHPGAFASLEAAFDPRSNANYAARFLNTLYAESKDWALAVAAYHSETPALGDAYRALVMARWQNGDLHAATAHQVTYGDFAQTGRAYGDRPSGGVASTNPAYGAFAPSYLVYGAFAPH